MIAGRVASYATGRPGRSWPHAAEHKHGQTGSHSPPARQRWPARVAVHDSQDGRVLGFIVEARVNVLALNVELHQKYPVRG